MNPFLSHTPITVPDNPDIKALIGKKIFIHLGPEQCDVVHCRLSLEPSDESRTQNSLKATNVACGTPASAPVGTEVPTHKCSPIERWYITPAGINAIERESAGRLRLPWRG